MNSAAWRFHCLGTFGSTIVVPRARACSQVRLFRTGLRRGEIAASPREIRHPSWALITTILASRLAFLEGSVIQYRFTCARRRIECQCRQFTGATQRPSSAAQRTLTARRYGGRSLWTRRPPCRRHWPVRSSFDRLRTRPEPALATNRTYAVGRRRRNVNAEQFGPPRLGLCWRSSRRGVHLGMGAVLAGATTASHPVPEPKRMPDRVSYFDGGRTCSSQLLWLCFFGAAFRAQTAGVMTVADSAAMTTRGRTG